MIIIYQEHVFKKVLHYLTLSTSLFVYSVVVYHVLIAYEINACLKLLYLFFIHVQLYLTYIFE